MQLLEHFRELTLHPKNAEELKGLILELALRGKLTSNLSRIGIKEDVVSGYYDLPENWYWDKFQNLCDFQMGKTPPSKESQYWDGGIPWISIADMTIYQTIYDTKKTISDLGLKNYFRGTLAKKGTLIMSFKLTIGKTSILGIDACHNEAIISIYPKKQILQEFLFLFLPVISNWGTQVSALMGNTLNKEKLQNLKVPVPPLAEQKAIVEVVNQLFAEVEQLEAMTKEQIKLKEDFVTSALNQLTQAAESEVANHWELVKSQFGTFFTEKSSIKKLRKAILQLAVQGKLTHHWRNAVRLSGVEVEPASVLLEIIKAEKGQLIKAGKIKKDPSTSLRAGKPLPEISEEEIPYDLPEGWVWCRLGDYVQCERGRFSARPRNSPEFYDGEYPFIQIGDINPNGGLINNHRQSLNQKGLQISKLFPKGTIVIAIVGATIGGTGILGYDMCFPDSLVGIKPSQDFDSNYLEIHLRTRKKQFQEISYAGGGQPNIKLPTLNESLFSLPPLAEQKAIVEKVISLMALCDQLEQEIETHQTTQEHWMQSCLREVV